MGDSNSTLATLSTISIADMKNVLVQLVISNYDIPAMILLLFILILVARYFSENGFFIPLPITIERLPSLQILTAPSTESRPRTLELPSHLQEICDEHLPKPPSEIPLADESGPGEIRLAPGHTLHLVTPSMSRYALVISVGERNIPPRALNTYRPVTIPPAAAAVCVPLPPNPSRLLLWRVRNRLRASAARRNLGSGHIFMRARAAGCAAEHALLVPAAWGMI